jgi:hypothetical protein
MTLVPEQQRRTVEADGFVNPLNLACNVEDETHVSVYVYKASWALKDLDPIPDNFREDVWWV